MNAIPRKSPDVTPVSTTPEKLESKIPRPFMEAVRASTAAALLNLSVAIASPALASSELSPYEPLADASGGVTLALKDTGDGIVSTMQSKGFSQSSIGTIRSLSNMIRDGKAAGKVQPGEYIGVEAVNPVSTDGTGLDGLISGGSKLPKKTFEAVTGAGTLNRQNYAQVVEALFDTKDVDLWMKGDEKEKTNYINSLASQKNRWLRKITELETKGENTVIAEWFDRFNTLTKTAIHGSREEFRRGFIAALSIAQYPSMNPKQQADIAPIIMAQTGEYALITNPKANLIKIEQSYNNTTGNGPITYGTLKYLVPNESEFDRIQFQAGKTTIQQTFDTWKARQIKTMELLEKDMKLDTRKGELDTRKGELDTRKGELDTRKGELDTSKRYTDLSREFNSVAKILISQLDELPQKRNDKDFLNSFNANIIRFARIHKEMDKITIQDTEKKIVSQKDRDMDREIYAKIIQTAQLHNVSIPKIDS